jgi:ABC-type polysaccharide/polyol phosphate export permease
MVQSIRELIARRDLLYILTWREIKVRYKQSVMGLAWAILMPLAIVCSGIVVRFAFSHVSGTPLALTDVTGVAVRAVPWAFVVGAIRFGTNSLITNSNLVTKVYMPRLAFPIAAVCAQLLDFVISAAVIGVLLAFAQTGLSIHLLWLPWLIVCLILMTSGLAVILSAASLFLRDVKYLVDVFLTFAIFFTPVFYESTLLGPWATLININPISPLLEALTDTVIHHQSPSLFWLGYSLLCTLLICAGSLVAFAKLEPLFAESV